MAYRAAIAAKMKDMVNFDVNLNMLKIKLHCSVVYVKLNLETFR